MRQRRRLGNHKKENKRTKIFDVIWNTVKYNGQIQLNADN